MSDPVTAPTPKTDPLIGRRISSYVVEKLLGAGGMGSVYLGVQPEIRKKVAIKFLAPHLNGNPDVVARFFDEAKAVNIIGHENIVDIFDFGKTPEGQNFFVMELLDGPSLAKALEATRAISPARVVDVGRQLASALAAAHARGVIHRDLKPDNVFLLRRAGQTDFVKILDFGIAKLSPPEGDAAVENDRRTKSGMILGTPGYMAPEQASGDQVDARADIYALGVLLYRMLAGDVPFAAQSFTATLLRQLTETAKRLDLIRGDLPEELVVQIDRMLARAPEDRPQTMVDVEADLAVLLAKGGLGTEVIWMGGTPLLGAPAKVPSTGKIVLAQTALDGGPTQMSGPNTEVGEAPAPAARPRRGGLPVAALLGIAVVAVVATFFVLKGRSTPTVQPPAVLIAEPPAVAPPVAAPPANAPPPTAPPAGPFKIRIESLPRGAQVLQGGHSLGVTPLDTQLDAAGPLSLRLGGYREERVEVHRADGMVRAVLQKIPPTKRSPGINLDD
ncbi:MAG: hypothetical protein EXR72_19715 [Myxococcales bacterium]|nr:hypothetical protein [Myxococcales bacterium]